MEKRVIPKKRYRWFDFLVAVLILVLFFGSFLLSRNGTTVAGGIFLLLLFVLVGGYVLYAQMSWRRVWKKLSQEIELNSHLGPFAKAPNHPRLTGYYRGYPILVDRFYILRGVMHTRIQIALASSPAKHRFRIETNDWVARVKRKYNVQTSKGLPYVEIGELVLDRSFLFQTNPPDFAREVFQPKKVRQGLVDIAPGVDEMSLALLNNRLVYHETGMMYDVAYLKAVIDWLVEISNQIERVTS